MEKYLAYFDILGFKEFIENNSDERIDQYIRNLFRDSQSAISGQNYIDGVPGTYVPDLSKANIHCIHISDSIIFWTEDISIDSFRNIVECSAFFLSRTLQATFPIRGCIVAGKMSFDPFKIKNENGITFYNSSLYGPALIDAYLKAEFQDWAGCYIDKSAIVKMEEATINEFIYGDKVAYYPVPLKDGSLSYEYVVRVVHHTINNVHFKNLAKGVEQIFVTHMNGKPITESVKRKLTNTIKFLDYFRQNTIPKEE